jgi:hypothetical protein
MSSAGTNNRSSSKLSFNIQSLGKIEYFARTQAAENSFLKTQRLTRRILFRLLARNAGLGSAKHVKGRHTHMIRTALR